MRGKQIGLLGDIVGRTVEKSVSHKAKNSAGKIAGKVYGNVAGKTTDHLFRRAMTSIDDANNAKMVEGSERELLSRNPENSKLIVIPDWKILNTEEHQVYRFSETSPDLRKWKLYDEKRKIATLREKKRSFFEKLFHRKADRRNFVIKIKGQHFGILQTVYEDNARIGETDFDDWYIKERKIYIRGRCIASFEKTRSWSDLRYILDFSKEIDEIAMILVLFAMEIADKQRMQS